MDSQASQPQSKGPLSERNANAAVPSRPASRLPMKQPLATRPAAALAVLTAAAPSPVENTPCLQPAAVEPAQPEQSRPAKRMKLDGEREAPLQTKHGPRLETAVPGTTAAPRPTAAAAATGRRKPLGLVQSGGSVGGTAAARSAGLQAKSSVKRPAQVRSSDTAARNSRNSSERSSQESASASNMPAPAAEAMAKKKRAPWDLKGRVCDLENAMTQQLQSSASAAAVHANEKQELRDQLRSSSSELEAMQQQLAARNSELAARVADLAARSEELAEARRQIAVLDQRLSAVQCELEYERQQRCASDARHAQTEKDLRDALAGEQAARADAEQRCSELGQKLRDMEICRRRQHNTIMELKGNIRVFCRVRPRLDIDPPGGDLACFPDSSDLKRVVEFRKPASALLDESMACAMGTSSGRANAALRFSFDRVFSPTENQQEVFEEVAQLIQSALDGFNVCIFAYGPTGSGKTFTMEGPSGQDFSSGVLPCNAGIIPRAIRQLFEASQELAGQGWQYKFEASFLEIYNEKIQDLLCTSKEELKYEIKMAGSSGTDVSVTNLTSVCVESPMQVAKLLGQAAQNRAVAATKCNERSSRSHSVFMLKIAGSNAVTGQTSAAVLNLIDLAGSERLKESGSEGARLQETKAINKSLSCLGNVIMAIGNKDSHVPYRDSKLTHLLQPSLGGNSKCLMFLNISQREEAFSETVISLRFAVKVNQCNIGTAQKKTK